MNLSAPNYLKQSNCQENSVRYAWDDWKTLPALESFDQQLLTRLKRISQRAVLAFACGSAEWMVYRFDRLCDTAAPWNLVESAWAMIAHLRYNIGNEAWSYRSQKGWEGPVKAPIKRGLEYLEAAFYSLHSEYRTDPLDFTARLSTLTSYVMPDALPYKRWSEQVVGRFEVLYPRDQADPLGDAVPRQAVDPEFDFRIEQTETLINAFLASLDYRSNPFLRSPQAVLEPFEGEEDFTGTPYVFSIDADRRTRRRRRD